MSKPDPNAETLEEMLRVDHAGEYGANRIYEGQLMVLGKSDMAPTLKHMLSQEQEHLKKFDELLNTHKARPSLLMPLWHAAGIALGVGSALMGKKAAMACTVAVEEVIGEHYQSQIDLIKDEELKKTITRFRDEELEHRTTGLEHNAKDMKGYEHFSKLVKLGAKASIWLAKKIVFILALFPLTANAAGLDQGIAAIRSGNYGLAYNIIEPMAQMGNPDAQFNLCGMFYQAQGVPKNDVEAFRWCMLSAKNENVEAMYNVGLMYQKGEGVGQNFNEAKHWYSEAAERGNTNAKQNLADLDGTMQKMQNEMAAHFTPTIAEPMPTTPGQKNMVQQNSIQNAEFVPQPPTPTPPSKFFANHTSTQNLQLQPVSQQQIAAQQVPLHASPQSVARMQAASATPAQQEGSMQTLTQTPGHPEMNELQPQIAPMQEAVAAPAPRVISQPIQVASNNTNYIPAPQQYEPASGNFATVPDVEQPVIIVDSNQVVDPMTACLIAAQRGQIYDICEDKTQKPIANKAPQLNTAKLQPAESAPLKEHSFNLDTEGNFSTSLEAAKKGNAEAQTNLGIMYRTGTGVARNYGEALKWFEKAASKGNVHAMTNLANMYQNGEGVFPNLELAYSWYNLAADRSQNPEDKKAAMENVQYLSGSLNNEEIGNALQYVTKLDEKIPAGVN